VGAAGSAGHRLVIPTAQARGLCHAVWRAAVAFVVCAALSGCASGPTFSQLFDDSAAGEGTGIQGAALVRAVVILARHQATPQQRAVAVRNAEAAIARMEREIATSRPKTVAKKKTTPRKKPSVAAQPSGGAKPKSSTKKLAAAPAPEPEAEVEPEPEPVKPAKKLPARIAVTTVKDEKTAPGAEAAVMIYDVQARRIVGNEVYDIEDEPRPNETVKFDTSVVRYVGATTY
jgi:hypothetical protein